jgi:hypothetical protein
MAFATLSGRLFICGSRGLSPPLPDRKVAAAASGGGCVKTPVEL